MPLALENTPFQCVDFCMGHGKIGLKSAFSRDGSYSRTISWGKRIRPFVLTTTSRCIIRCQKEFVKFSFRRLRVEPIKSCTKSILYRISGAIDCVTAAKPSSDESFPWRWSWDVHAYGHRHCLMASGTIISPARLPTMVAPGICPLPSVSSDILTSPVFLSTRTWHKE